MNNNEKKQLVELERIFSKEVAGIRSLLYKSLPDSEGLETILYNILNNSHLINQGYRPQKFGEVDLKIRDKEAAKIKKFKRYVNSLREMLDGDLTKNELGRTLLLRNAWRNRPESYFEESMNILYDLADSFPLEDVLPAKEKIEKKQSGTSKFILYIHENINNKFTSQRAFCRFMERLLRIFAKAKTAKEIEKTIKRSEIREANKSEGHIEL